MKPPSQTENVKEKLARWGYSTILWILLPFMFSYFLIKSISGSADYRRRKLQRFGGFSAIKNKGGIFCHCVSVGEVVVAASVIKRIRAKNPELPVTISTTTMTGCEQVKTLFGESVSHLYLPYDLTFLMRSVINRINPKIVLITEVELWPNLIHVCWQQGIPCYVINARLTDKSVRAYKKFSALFVPMVNKLTAICAQGARDFSNYRKLGVCESRLFLTNNIKFDQTLSDQDEALAEKLHAEINVMERQVILGASTHDPEETHLLNCYRKLKLQFPQLLLVMVPRHPERFDKVEKSIVKQGLRHQRLSKDSNVRLDCDVLLIDRMGILKSIYSLATVAFVGGSLAKRGGHNALEAALFSKPIIMGPHTFNNPAVCQTLQSSSALKIVSNEDELASQLAYWLTNPQAADKAGTSGAEVLRQNAGAISATLKIIGF